VEYGWVARDLLPEGRWRIAPVELITRLAAHQGPTDGLVLVNRRDVRRLNSVVYAGDGEAVVRIHPDDAPGVAQGEEVEVTSAHGSLRAQATLDTAMTRGTVSVGHGRAAADVAMLTSATSDVDLLTGMPHASGLPVTMTRMGSGAVEGAR
jgi:anaerobic selenocysteine-containing dehydrogenase